MLCAVNYSEILIGPIAAGVQDTVDAMLVRFGVEIITVDMDLAQRAAAVRARTRLKLPDAYALATAVHAEHRGLRDVSLATFDEDVLKAHRDLHTDA